MYMRLFIESHESMLLTATSELYSCDLHSFASYVSYLIAVEVFIASILLPVMAFYVFMKYRENFQPDK